MGADGVCLCHTQAVCSTVPKPRRMAGAVVTLLFLRSTSGSTRPLSCPVPLCSIPEALQLAEPGLAGRSQTWEGGRPRRFSSENPRPDAHLRPPRQQMPRCSQQPQGAGRDRVRGRKSARKSPRSASLHLRAAARAFCRVARSSFAYLSSALQPLTWSVFWSPLFFPGISQAENCLLSY